MARRRPCGPASPRPSRAPRRRRGGTGRALVSSTVAVTLGSARLLPAEFAPTFRFSLLCSAAMLADLWVLPAILGDRRG